jgi:hypothetical protein
MATTRIALRKWLSFLILRETRKHDAYTREDNNGDANNNNNFVKKKKQAQLEYIETAVCVAIHLVQSLILTIVTQQITIDNFSVVIEDSGDIILEENPEDENLQKIIQSITELEFASAPSRKDDSVHDANNGEQQVDDDKLLREVGTIFHQLFCRGVKPPISTTNVPSSDEGEGDEDGDHHGDSEQTGAEKGRSKHSIRVAQKMLRRASISSLDEHMLRYGVPKSLCRLVIDLIRL